MVVRRYTSFEARFVVRGDLDSKEDLAFCLSAAEKKAQQLGCCVLSTQERIIPEWLDALNTFQQHGFEITDEVRVTIAGKASMLLLNRSTRAYPDLKMVLVYPSAFVAPRFKITDFPSKTQCDNNDVITCFTSSPVKFRRFTVLLVS